MSDDYGHVKISRRAYAEDVFWLEPRVFSRWEAWEWLIQAAAWKPRPWISKGSTRVLQLQRGETPPLSLRRLADAWGWDKMRVSRFLETLGETGMRRIRDGQRDSNGDTYILVNYDTYQSSRDSKRDDDETAVRQQRDSSETHKEAVKQLNNSLPTGEKNTHTPARAREKSTRTSRRCPVDWQPNDGHRQLALSLGVDLLSELEFFRDYTYASGKSDWDATFRNWLRTAAEKHSRSNGNGNGKTVQAAGEDAGELQRRRQQEMEKAEAEYQAQRTAWKKMIAERWEAEPQEVRDRIRGKAEAEFASLRSDELRFKRAVDPRAVQLYAEEIQMPAPTKRTA